MVGILLVSGENGALSELASGLRRSGEVRLHLADTGRRALEIVAEETIDLAIADEKTEDMAGLEFIKELVAVNPMVNCALVSHLSPGEYHDASEGLGLLMQLPVRPGERYATILLEQLAAVLSPGQQGE